MLSFEEFKKLCRESGGAVPAKAEKQNTGGTKVMTFEEWKADRDKRREEEKVSPKAKNKAVIETARKVLQAHQTENQEKWDEWQRKYAEAPASAETPESKVTEISAEETPGGYGNRPARELLQNSGIDYRTKAMVQAEQFITEKQAQDQLETLLNEAQANLDAYLESEDHRRIARQNMAAKGATLQQGTMASSYPAAAQNTTRQIDTKEVQLRAIRDYYKNLYDAQVSQKIMDADLAELETWSDEERKALTTYVNFRQNGITSGGYAVPAYDAYAMLAAKYGAEKVNQLAYSWQRDQNAKAAQALRKSSADAVKGKTGASTLHSAATVPANLLGSVTGVQGTLVDLATRDKRYPTLDPNNAGNMPNVYSGAVRGQVAENISGDQYDENGNLIKDGGTLRQIASYAYQGLMSSADTLARAAVGGGSKAISLGLAATGSFSQTVSDASARGASPGQAVLLGTINGGLEVATEYLPLDEIMNVAKGGPVPAKQLLKNIFKQAAIEVTEEEVSFLGSLLAESAILQEKSAYNQKVAEAVANGETLQDAREKANRDIVLEAAETAITSGFAGGGSALVSSTEANVRTEKAGNQMYGDDPKALIDEALEIDSGNEYAKKLKQKADGGKKLGGRELYTLAQQNSETLTQRDKEAIRTATENRLTQLGETGNVKAIAEILTKQAAGEKLTRAENSVLNNSQYGQRVANELDAENIREGGYTSDWAKKIGTDQIHVAEYNSNTETENAATNTEERHKQTGNEPQTVPENGQVRVSDEGTARLASPIGVDNTREQFQEAKRVAAQYGVDIKLYTDYEDGRDSYVEDGEIYINTESKVPMQQIVDQHLNRQAQNAVPEGKNVTQNGQNVTQTAENVAAQAQTAAENQNVNGGREYGNTAERTESGRTGDRVLSGSRQRNDGAGTGEQAGRMAGRTGAAAQGRDQRTDRFRAQNQRNALGRDLRLQKVSSASLGILSGTDMTNLQVIPEERWDESLRQKAEQVYEETGKKVTYVLGRIQIKGTGGKTAFAKGVATAEGIIVQANHPTVSAEQIADHEAYHGMRSFYGQKLNDQLIEKIREQFTEEEFGKVVDRYIAALSGTIDVAGAQTGEEFEQRMQQIMEEILADAYAGMNSFGAGATQFTDTVNRFLAENGISRRQMQENGVRQTNGPPAQVQKNTADDGGERYSLASIEDITPTDDEKWQNIQKVALMEAVYMVDASRLVPGERSIKEIYGDLFQAWGNNIHTELFGDVAVKNSSIRSEMRHGSTPVKVASIEAIPTVLQNGRIIEWFEKSSGLLRIVVAAPIKIGNTPYFMGVMLQRDAQNQRLYLHDVVIEKEASDTSQEHLDSTGPYEENENLYMSSILDRIVKVKRKHSSNPLNDDTVNVMDDDAYLEAVQSGDLETAQRMVDEAAKAAGYTVRGFHGSGERFNTFSYGHIGSATGVGILGEGFYFGDDKGLAKMYGSQLYDSYLRMENTYHATEGDQYKINTAELTEQGYDSVDLVIGGNGKIYCVFDNTQIKSADPVTYDDDGNVIPLSERFNQENQDIRYSVDELDEEEYARRQERGYEGKAPTQQELEQERQEWLQREYNRNTAQQENKPTISKRELRTTMMSIFSIPDGQRAELGQMIDNYADRLIKNGMLTEDDRRVFFDRMYDAGVMTVPADEYMAMGRSYLVNGRIYVNDSVRTDFGDDWESFRKRAFAAGVYLTRNSSDPGIDAWNHDLSSPDMVPGLFDSEETDLRTILEQIVSVAEAGKDEHMSLAEYTKLMAGQDFVSEDEFLDNMERQMDWALRTFAEKAGLEVRLRNSADRRVKTAQGKVNERLAQQAYKDLQRRAKERETRKEMNRQQRERKELRELQQKTLKQLQWLSKNRNRAPEELRSTWDEVLGDIDIYAVGAANEMNWSNKYNATWMDLAQMYKDAMTNDPNFLPSKDLERIVARLDGSKIEDMDLGALQDLYKAAIGLRTEFYNRNNVINDEKQRLFEEVYSDVKKEINAAPGGFTGRAVDKFLNMDQLTPMNVMQRMAGWDPNSTFYSMARQLERGERDMRAYSVKAQRMLQEFLTENEDWVKKADGQGKDAIWYELEVPQLVELGMGNKPIFGPTVKVYMTPAQKVHMYLESKNLDNLRHMTGGRTFADKELYSQGKRQEALSQGRTIRLAPETVKKIVSDLTAEEMELARVLDRYYNTFATQEINRVSNILYGYDKAMGRNYAPIYTNRNYTKAEFGVFDSTAEGVGNLKGRQYAVNPSYNISAFDAFERHIDQTARFVGMAIPARNWTTLMNWREKNSSTGDIITHKWGEEGKKYITDLITALQASEEFKTDTISSALSKLQSNYITAIFGANPSIVLKQLGSIPMGAAYLGAKNMPKPAQIKNIDRDLISKYTQDLEWRTMGYSMPETKHLKENPTKLQSNKFCGFVFGGDAITAMDGWAASTLWPWAENKVRREHPELEVGTAEQVAAGVSPFYKKVAEEFEDAVARSQSTSDEIHQSRIRKSKNPVTKAFTMFRSDSAQTYNTIRQKIGEAQYLMRVGEKGPALKAAKKAVGQAFMAMLINATWSEAVSFLMALWKNKGKSYRDDDDELTWQSIAGEMASNMLGSIAGTVTLGEELFELVGNVLTGNKIYDIETPGMEQLNDVIDVLTKAGSGMREIIDGAVNVVGNGGNLLHYLGKHGNDMLGYIKNIAETAAMYLGGVPVSNVEAYLLGAFKWISPGLGAAYDDLFSSAAKSDLSGMSGKALTYRISGILDSRDVDVTSASAEALAELYEAGYKDAVPSDIPGSITVNGEIRALNEYQKQTYGMAWTDVVSETIEDLIISDSFSGSDQELRTKMLSGLYSYAGDIAKAQLFEDYEMGTTNQTIAEMVSQGAELHELIALKAAGGNIGKLAKAVESGADFDSASDALIDAATLREQNNEAKDVEFWRLCVNSANNEATQLSLLYSFMNESTFAKVKMAADLNVSPDMYVTYYETRSKYDADGNGSYTQAEVKSVIDAMKGCTNEQKGILWQMMTGSTSTKNNPYSKEAGQKWLDAKTAAKDKE